MTFPSSKPPASVSPVDPGVASGPCVTGGESLPPPPPHAWLFPDKTHEVALLFRLLGTQAMLEGPGGRACDRPFLRSVNGWGFSRERECCVPTGGVSILSWTARPHRLSPGPLQWGQRRSRSCRVQPVRQQRCTELVAPLRRRRRRRCLGAWGGSCRSGSGAGSVSAASACRSCRCSSHRSSSPAGRAGVSLSPSQTLSTRLLCAQ